MNPEIYFKYIKYILLDISALSNRISINKIERFNLIRKCAPGNVRSYSYDRPAVDYKNIINDEMDLHKIEQIDADIKADTMLLNEKRAALSRMREQGVKAAMALKDKVLMVYILSYVDSLSNVEIAEKLGYEIHTIENLKYEINKIFKDIEAN